MFFNQFYNVLLLLVCLLNSVFSLQLQRGFIDILDLSLYSTFAGYSSRGIGTSFYVAGFYFRYFPSVFLKKN